MSYSPVTYSEKRDNLVTNIVRSVSSLNLQTLETAYHNVRYKIDYHLIHARLKYYSNSKNPRVIHTKLNHQHLITLRTNPNDPYFVKPGEFLTLGSSEPDYNAGTLDGLLKYYCGSGSADVESCPATLCGKEQDHGEELIKMKASAKSSASLRLDSIKAPLVLAENQGNIGYQVKFTESQKPATLPQKWKNSSASSVVTTRSLGFRRMRKMLHIRGNVSVIKEEDLTNLNGLPLVSALPQYLASNFSLPIIEEPHTLPSQRENEGQSPKLGCEAGLAYLPDSPYSNYGPYTNLLQIISPSDSVSLFRQNLSRQPRLLAQSARDKPEDKKVWQVVLSDISLSAARLSTGSEGTSRGDYESLKGDLTNAKVKDQDCFAENMKQAKAKFYGANTGSRGNSGGSRADLI